MDRFDLELRQALKSWVANHPLPTSGRARLLSTAASLNNPADRTSPFQFVEIPNMLLTWAMVYSMEGRIGSLRSIS